jgi:hypothetical protein
MPTPRAPRPSPQQRYWQKRLAAPAFRRALTTLVAGELRQLGRQKVGAVVDPELVRTLIRHWDSRLIDRGAVAEVMIAANRRSADRLTRRDESLIDLLDRQLVADLEAALDASLEMTDRARDFVATLMQRDFVQGLFADVIFTAVVSFQQKANPFFGAFATRALEGQIKGFIRLFMPMLQAQATAFAVDRANQRAVLDFARAVARQLLEVPIGRYAALAGRGGGASMERLMRRAAENPALADLGRRAALASWDDLFAALQGRRIGALLPLGEHADWLAERCVEGLLPALQRPAVVAFIAAEAAAVPPAPPSPKRKR